MGGVTTLPAVKGKLCHQHRLLNRHKGRHRPGRGHTLWATSDVRWIHIPLPETEYPPCSWETASPGEARRGRGHVGPSKTGPRAPREKPCVRVTAGGERLAPTLCLAKHFYVSRFLRITAPGDVQAQPPSLGRRRSSRSVLLSRQLRQSWELIPASGSQSKHLSYCLKWAAACLPMAWRGAAQRGCGGSLTEKNNSTKICARASIITHTFSFSVWFPLRG